MSSSLPPGRQSNKQPTRPQPRLSQTTVAGSHGSKLPLPSASIVGPCVPKKVVSYHPSASLSCSAKSPPSSSSTKLSSFTDATSVLQKTPNARLGGFSPSLSSNSFSTRGGKDVTESKTLTLLTEESTFRFREGVFTIRQHHGETTYNFSPILEHFPDYWILKNENDKLLIELGEEKEKRKTAEENLNHYSLQMRKQQERESKFVLDRELGQKREQEQMQELKKLKKDIEYYQVDIDQKTEANSQLDKALEDAGKSNRVMKAKLDEAEKSKAADKAAYDLAHQSMETQNEALRKQLRKASSDSECLKDRVSQNERDLQDMKEANEHLTQANKAQDAELQQSKECLSAEQGQVAMLQQQLSHAATTSASEIMVLRDELSNTQQQLANTIETNTILNDRLTQAAQSLSTEQALVDSLQQELSHTAEEVANSADEMNLLRVELTQKEHNLVTVRERLGDMENELRNLRYISNSLQSEERDVEVTQMPRRQRSDSERNEDWTRLRFVRKVRKNRRFQDSLRRHPLNIHIAGNPRRLHTPVPRHGGYGRTS